SAASVRVGSKQFTESVILGELACHLVRHAQVECDHQRELGGTQILWQALLRGDIDAYPEYSGTITQEIFSRTGVVSKEELEKLLDEAGVRMSAPLGFNNTYALAMRKARAQELGVAKLSDLERHPELAIRFSNEFMDRKDGWPALRQAYGLKQADVRGLDHDLAYRGIEAGHIDVLDVYSTDAEIAYYDLVVLTDDRAHFPRYDAVLLARKQIPSEAWRALTALEGRIDDATMQRMNAAAKLEGLPEAAVAARFAGEKLGIKVEVKEETRMSRIFLHTREHLSLVAASLAAALVFALPLGIVAARRRRWGQAILATVGVIQTIPSLALLVFMIPLLGIGGPPAIVALFLYSLLPIVRNTHQGLTSIAPSLLESAEALGLPPRARLWRIELPLASRAILAGVKTSAVINVGTATLGALVGAGGYGQPILTGIRLDDVGLIMEGALPAAALALLVEGIFNVSERIFVPRGLRLER
ncbi:MAG TPA: glycine betaine ABC transporter substrate-binding protein, partial [Polyangiaceae bacterium]|nr:glycine betaine ABC transporter substrate-binding protein [Polyangiaceae bacterium]